MESFLTVLQQVCSPSVYKELTNTLNQDHLADIIQQCCVESNIAGLATHDQISKVLLFVGDTVLYLLGNNEKQCEFTIDNVYQVESLLSLCSILISSLVKTAREHPTSEILLTLKHVMKKTAAEIVIVCAGHVEEHQWTSKLTTKTTQDILQLVCEGCRTKSTSELLAGSTQEPSTKTPLFQKGLLPEMLDVFQTKLISSPALPHIVYWSITQVKYPHLGDHLSKLLTLVLQLTDDHQVDNKVIGVKCLHHVMKNSNAAELVWYGRCDVIFETLQRIFYLSEPNLLEALYPCMVLNLQINESRGKQEMIKHCDKVIQLIFTSMEYESNQLLRRIHAFYLKDVVNHIGIYLLSYFKRFLVLVLSYIHVYDDQRETVRVNTLEALKAAMLNLWPRIGGHAEDILEALLKLLVDCGDMENEDTKEQLLDACVQCLVVLKHCCPHYIQNALYTIQAEVHHTQVQQCVSRALQQLT